MGVIQSGINKLLGAAAGASAAYQKSTGKGMIGKSDLIQKQKVATKKVEEVKQAKKTQRRNFMDYLKKQETSLGGTVGELPPAIQKQIASTYTKSQRKTMMDRMDREAGNGSK